MKGYPEQTLWSLVIFNIFFTVLDDWTGIQIKFADNTERDQSD